MTEMLSPNNFKRKSHFQDQLKSKLDLKADHSGTSFSPMKPLE